MLQNIGVLNKIMILKTKSKKYFKLKFFKLLQQEKIY
ncbi:Hypothetical Protein SLY_1120 [Strawberry lethal yellows phytoplasma (CPA) str. NZSb11]|uniref:Uncharacterized protein n=1 Tax=Strawberry lethal yellows phytoplasma (CPA) str. NZSb11 TaxID=980422 RepID=R4RR92_PHYAS|nr:Hypothetical Protein SLY_1120 [Strawberry lethal yellows phytoplasma (CPA) str. NZSb11]